MPDHWQAISQAEQIHEQEVARQKKLAAEEWDRGAPERERVASNARREQELASLRAAEKAERRRVAERWSAFWPIYFLYLLPIVTIFSGVFVAHAKAGRSVEFSWSMLIAFVPILNWLILGGISLSNDGKLAIQILAIWVMVGVIGYLGTRDE